MSVYNFSRIFHTTTLVKDKRDILIEEMSRFFTIQLETKPIRLNKNMILWDENSQKIRLVELFSSKPKLYLKYSEIGCNICINNQIKILKKLSNEIGNDNIVILANYRQRKNMMIFKRLHQLDLKICNTGERIINSIGGRNIISNETINDLSKDTILVILLSEPKCNKC